MRNAIKGLIAFGLAGCSTAGAEPLTDMVTGGDGEMICDPAVVQEFVGKRAHSGLGARILRDSGARTLRWGAPNSAWTKDFRQDRVNVQHDAGMTITRITCG